MIDKEFQGGRHQLIERKWVIFFVLNELLKYVE
jgi:hypothetical protein